MSRRPRSPLGRRGVRRLLAALALLVVTGAPAAAQADDAPPFGVAEGMIGPDFTMLDLEGRPVRLRDLRGAPVLLNFWASWCPPCVAELPLLDRAARDLEGEAHVLLLNVGEPHGTVAPFLAELGIADATVLRDAREDERPVPDGVVPSRAVAQVYRTFGLPTSLLLDRHGIVAARVSGPVDELGLRALLARADVAWSP
jgi:thiol-disulfide isomerase/thioredoxin